MKVYLYFYTDSVGFPNIKEQQPEHTWPFLLKSLIESNSRNIVYSYQRGLGGATIKEISVIFEHDKGYFRSYQDDSISFIIYNVGVVDAAPVPFTYILKNLNKIPYVGSYLWYIVFKIIRPNRAFYQKIFSYRRTGLNKFKYIFNGMVNHSLAVGIVPISINTPLMPSKFERRSPGLNAFIKLYNMVKQDNKSILHLDASWVNENFLADDGHHFNIKGHKELADRLYQMISKSVS